MVRRYNVIRDMRQGTCLTCFSPPVMVATFAIEIVMVMYSVWRFRLNVTGRLVVAILCFLAFFQLSEYFVCGGLGVGAMTWGRAGYVAITMLPPLGLHLLYALAGRRVGRVVSAAYLSAAVFIGWFLTQTQAFAGYACTGNYVIFQLADYNGLAYGVYYYGWLLATMALALRWMRGLMSRGKRSIGKRRTILMLVVGYLTFMVPTAIVNTVAPATRNGIPSVMCGFAVMFAGVLVGYILPRVGLRRTGRGS